MGTKIQKNKTADIPTKSGNKYSYQYVDIAQIHDYLESINAKYIQQVKRIDDNDYIMTKRCFDEKWEDEWLQGCRVVDATLMGVNNPAQQQGSAITYARRYSLLMAFGLATEDDDASSLSVVKEITQEDADTYKLTFGKYKGKTFKEIQEEKPDYLDWLLDNSKDENIKKMIELATGKKPLSEEEQKETLNKLAELNDLMNKANVDREALYKHYKVKSNSQMSLEQIEDAIKIIKEKYEV